MSDQIRQQVTDRILNALEHGQVPWGRPWLGHRNDGPPTNILTSLPFQGVNPLLLNLAGFRSKWWAMETCWRAFGFQAKPHQKGTQVCTGRADDLQGQTVFNAEQVDGLGVERYLVGDTKGRRLPDYEVADRVITATGTDIRHVPGNEAAYYRLPKDYIILPLKSQFVAEAGGLPASYNTALHELCHFSEHRLRWLADPHLGRQDSFAIGDLRATFGAAFLTAQIGTPFCHNQVAHPMYLGTWTRLMRADPTLSAVSHSTRLAVLGLQSGNRRQVGTGPSRKRHRAPRLP
jgi:antirestriction protein ArdC